MALTCTHRPLIARCVEPGCRCLHQAGFVVASEDEAPAGYAVEREPGLCPDCRADYDADPSAWEEYGPHPEGEARRAELRAEMAAARPPAPQPAPRRPTVLYLAALASEHAPDCEWVATRAHRRDDRRDDRRDA